MLTQYDFDSRFLNYISMFKIGLIVTFGPTSRVQIWVQWIYLVHFRWKIDNKIQVVVFSNLLLFFLKGQLKQASKKWFSTIILVIPEIAFDFKMLLIETAKGGKMVWPKKNYIQDCL